MTVNVYVVFKKYSDTNHALTPFAVVGEKPAKDDDIDFYKVELYQNRAHLERSKELNNIRPDDRKVLGLTSEKIKTRLCEEFGVAAVTGKGLLPNKIVYVSIDPHCVVTARPDYVFMEEASAHSKRSADRSQFLDRKPTSLVLARSLDELEPERVARRAEKRLVEAKSRLSPDLRRMLDLD